MPSHAIYNNPAGGQASSIGTQFRTDYYDKMALIDARKEQYFMPLSSTVNLPKNFGKKIKKFMYVPLLDDRNVNDQGINAAGATIANGNLYGSSKDIGTIPSKLPTLSENGGRVNRVGFHRLEVQGTIQKMGFFTEYTQESLDFDTDEQLYEHMSRELVSGAHEITEDMLQIDLINNAGITKFCGNATATANVGSDDVVAYSNLLRLSIDLDNNRTPKHTKIISGTRLTDTRTLPASRVMYVGSELQPTLEAMKDLHNNPAFIPAHKYAAGADLLNGEIGSISNFRIVVVPEMMKWSGAGAALAGNTTHYGNGTNFDVFPMLVVGSESFSTIGFQTDGKTVKFRLVVKKPGEETADVNDPYGEKGFSSIKWYYGFLAERPERIALIKTAAVM